MLHKKEYTKVLLDNKTTLIPVAPRVRPQYLHLFNLTQAHSVNKFESQPIMTFLIFSVTVYDARQFLILSWVFSRLVANNC